MNLRATLAFFCAVVLLATPVAAQPATKFGKWGVDLTALDPSVKPGDDFFLYVNGSWVKIAAVPADRSAAGFFQELQILSEERQKSIINDLEKSPDQRLTVEEHKLRDLYDSFVDTNSIEAHGLAPVRKDLDYLGGLKTREDVAHAMGSVKLATISIYNIYIAVDDRNPDNYAVNLNQGGLGMPDRGYYLSNDATVVKTRTAYRNYLAGMMQLAGMGDAEARADRVLALETAIAKVWSDRREEDKDYSPMPVSALKRLAPDFAWDAFLSEGGIPLKMPDGNDRRVIVAEKNVFALLATIFKNTPVSTWRDYLTVHYLHRVAPYLPKRFDDLTFLFYGTMLTGRTKQLDRQTRAMHLLDQQMGDALGKLYVARYFPPSAKANVDLLVSNLLKTYEADIQTLDWMAPVTRAKALTKLRQLTTKIGYPVKWRDYTALEVVRGDPVGNARRVAAFDWNRDVARISQPVDRGEWGLTPSSINAYYNFSFNEVVLPAGILQPPFFDPNADDAVNYGAIGAIMAGQISQAFDDSGSGYDERGAVQDWWTRQDRANFAARAAPLVKQYDSYKPLSCFCLHVNGRATLAQNIADNAGLAIALKAYHLSLNGRPAPVIGGYSGDQRLFLSFGQMWRTKMRDSAIRTQTLSNEHTVAEFRVIGPTRNMDAWYDAFAVKPGEKYYLAPPERVHLW